MSVPKCRLCNSGPNNQKIIGDYVYGGLKEHKFWKCSVCDAVYLYPSLEKQDEEKFYREEFEKFMFSRSGGKTNWNQPEKHIKANEETVRRRWKYLRKEIQNNSRLLEIGCSSGFMLDHFKKNGIKTVGIEPSNIFLEYLKLKGYPVYQSLDDLKKAEIKLFDIITHFFVLEHIRDPEEFLRSQLEMLNPGGKIIFEIPCVNDPLLSVYKIPSFGKFYWSVAHHWYFSPTSLSFLLDKLNCKYKLIPEQRYDLSNHIIWMLEGKPGGQNHFSNIFSDELINKYQQDLKDKWLCDTIICIIQKPKKGV